MEHIMLDRTTTWSRLGEDVSKCKDMAHVLKKSGLDYEVVKMPINIADGTEIPNRFVTARPKGEGLRLYDVVSDKFEIIQNSDAFDFVNYMGSDLTFDKAGETANGMVYIIAHLPEVNILGDSFTPHVIFRNGFSGKVKITAAICPLRIVCQNQFNFAFKNAQNSITVRHVQNAEKKLEEARETLKLSADYMAELNAVAEHFAKVRMSKAQVENVVKYLFPIPEDTAINPMKRKVMEESRAALIHAYNAEDNRNFHGRAWGLINAYTDFITHKEPAGKRDDRFDGKFVNTTFKLSMNPIIHAIEAIA